jgi:hypothetical protein
VDRVLRRRAPVVSGSSVGGGVVDTASVSSVVEPQENGLYQAICYSISFYLFSALCSDAGQNVGSEESNCEDDQDE